MTVDIVPFKVIIVGGGLAGSLLANGLIGHDIEVQVYERTESHSKREGLQIRLTTPALAGMRTCLSPEHFASVIKRFGPASGLKAEAPKVYHKDWTLLLDLSRFSVYGKNAPINRGILRDALADPVYDAGRFHYNKTFEKYEIIKNASSTEGIRVHFSDGSIDECTILIGADGSYSRINQQVGLNNIKSIERHVAFAAKCQLPTERFLKMSRELLGGPVMTWSDEMSFFFGVYLPTKYDENGKKVNSDDSSSIYDESLSSCMVGLNVAKEQVPPGLTEADLDTQWKFFSDSIEHWSRPHREAVEVVRGAPLHIYVPRVASRPPKGWRKSIMSSSCVVEKGHSNVWLMGDAIHAMLPPRGMGGNQAMYDAAMILPKLVQLAEIAKLQKQVPREAIEAALTQYEAEMIPRAFEWVKKSGGDNFVPIDSSTLTGRLFFILAAQVLNIACLWQWIGQVFFWKPPVDDTPEFSTL